MNNKQFCNSFYFTKIAFSREHHTDCSKAPGTLRNYIGMLINGSGKLITKGKTITVRKNEPFFIPLGCRYHSFWYPENGEVSWHSLGFELMPLSRDRKPTLQKLTFNDTASGCFEHIVADYCVNSGTVGSLYSLLSELESSFEYTNSRINPIAEAALDILARDPFQSICQTAEKCGVSESALYSAFKHSLGYSPNFARQKIICERAIQLLETTDLPIEEISGESGFSSSSYFRKVFRLHTGLTPREVRKKALF